MKRGRILRKGERGKKIREKEVMSRKSGKSWIKKRKDENEEKEE